MAAPTRAPHAASTSWRQSRVSANDTGRPGWRLMNACPLILCSHWLTFLICPQRLLEFLYDLISLDWFVFIIPWFLVVYIPMRYSWKINSPRKSPGTHQFVTFHQSPQIAPSINPSLDSDCTTFITDLCADSQWPTDMGDTTPPPAGGSSANLFALIQAPRLSSISRKAIQQFLAERAHYESAVSAQPG